MRRFKDSLVGFKLTSMMSVLHAACFLAFYFLETDEMAISIDPLTELNVCETWDTARNAIWYTHFLNTMFTLLSPFLIAFGLFSFEAILDYGFIIFYQCALIYMQTMFLHHQVECGSMYHIKSWMALEMAIYYCLILAAILYLFIEFLRPKGPNSVMN